MKKWTMGLVVVFGLSFGLVSLAADFNGDGIGDIAIFRASSGLWSVRGITRVYFGSSGDNIVPGDYNGSGTDQPSIFRGTSGLWAARGVTRIYFGGGSDAAMPGDYNGDGTYDVGIFRATSGLWAAKGITRVYYGSSTDTAISPGEAKGSGGRLLKTGQFTEYSSGDDGTYQAGIDFSYQTDDPAGNGEIIVIDNVTGLMWASDGDGAGCNFGNQTDWYSAIDWANNLVFAGYSDWRLPNRRELESLIDTGLDFPAIDPIFINTKSDYYWSASTRLGDSSSGWGAGFDIGNIDVNLKSSPRYVRAVRGGE